MSFNDYWKEKVAKRRKSWANKVRRYREDHTPLEDIREEVFQPLDYVAGFRIEDYKRFHYVSKNPAIKWQDGVFSFDDEGLKAALIAEGADLTGFKFESARESIVGLEAPQPKIARMSSKGWSIPNIIFQLERECHAWLGLVYEICTTVERVQITYRDITMAINRYTDGESPFAYYEIIPSSELIASELLMEETGFYTLNVATLLMEMAAEFDLRQEEFNYFAKAFKVRQMEMAVTDSIEFTLWDDKKLESKIKEYIQKDFTLDKMLQQVLRPWKQAVKKFVDAVNEREVARNSAFYHNRYNDERKRDEFVNNYLLPHLAECGMEDVKEEHPQYWYFSYGNFYLSNQGERMMVSGLYGLCPNVSYGEDTVSCSLGVSLGAISEYLKRMPGISKATDAVVIKALRIYDALMQNDERYKDIVDTLEQLSNQHVGTPVGKIMKYLRWNTAMIMRTKMDVHSIKVLNDAAFTFVCGERGLDNILERWIDDDCRFYYKMDPSSDDFKELLQRYKNNRHNGPEKMRYPVQSFMYEITADFNAFLSVEFVLNNL